MKKISSLQQQPVCIHILRLKTLLLKTHWEIRLYFTILKSVSFTSESTSKPTMSPDQTKCLLMGAAAILISYLVRWYVSGTHGYQTEDIYTIGAEVDGELSRKIILM